MSRDIGDSRWTSSAGVSSLVAPVAAVRLDQVAREDLTGPEVDDRDFTLVHDGQDPPVDMGSADLEMVQAAGPAQGDGALLVGDVVAQAEVTPCARAGGRLPHRQREPGVLDGVLRSNRPARGRLALHRRDPRSGSSGRRRWPSVRSTSARM